MPVVIMRGSIVSVPKWTVEMKKSTTGLVKTARCMFQVQDGFRATCFVSHMPLLDLLVRENVSAGKNVIVSGKCY